ncbi:anthranilate synthase component I [Methanosarcinales archaeon]|nr:MAG: anthranilate synthase component I [Methanosarcinales archaeon]
MTITPDNDEPRDVIDAADTPRDRLVQIAIPINTSLTPLQAYAALRSHDSSGYSYLLESAEKEKRHARFSFVGANPLGVITVKKREIKVDLFAKANLIDRIKSNLGEVCEKVTATDHMITGQINTGCDVFDSLRAAIMIGEPIEGIDWGRQVFTGGVIGFAAYDCVYYSHLDLKPFQSRIPDAQFALTAETLIFDHLSNRTYLVKTEELREDADQREIRAQIGRRVKEIEELFAKTTPEDNVEESDSCFVGCTADKREFELMVKRAKEHIINGDILQVVLSRRYEIKTRQSACKLYQKPRKVNPSPYMYLFEFGNLSIIGASPETLLTVKDRKVITNPIAGTCPRGRTPEEDEAHAREMLSNEKERAEHVMLVDLGRNDVRAVAKAGSVVVEDYMSVLKYSHVQHIESTVTGELRDECDAFDATRAIFPAGTLSGAPKIRAMEIIHNLEENARGVYGGGVGYYCFNGDADFAIVIRTMIKEGNMLSVQAGAGIVADSDPEYEYNETERKMAAMIEGVLGGLR